MHEPQWLTWARELQAHAQNGLAYSRAPYDLERFRSIRRIAVEIMAAYSGADLTSLAGLFDGEAGYATPKVDVRAAVFQDDAILMVREKTDGAWSLPGGWADVGESPGEMAAREVFEESGYRVRPARLLAVYDRNRHAHPPIPYYVYKLVFQCDLIGGAPAESMETDGIGFFKEDALPELSLTRVVPEQIRRIFEHYRHPDLPADFD